MTKAQRIFAIAQEVLMSFPDFHLPRGPGDGNRQTNAFCAEVRKRALAAFAHDYAERPICGDTNFRADYYFPDEATIVEIALGLPNSNTEFEKDILKAIVARDHDDLKVDRLIFISRSGAKSKCNQAGRKAMLAWALKWHRLEIEIHELDGPRRKRNPRTRNKDARPVSPRTRAAF